jgi:two-component system response regulator VanR
MSMLKLLRGVTHAPIFVSTTTFTAQEQAEAVSNGADLFAPIGETPSHNYDSIMACINRLNERAKQPKPDIELVTYKDILIVPSHHRAFIIDEEIRLSKNEMDILYHLTTNRGKILSHEQLYEKLTNTHESNALSADNIYATVKRLRKKMKEVSQVEYIETVRDVGYRLITT